METINRIRFFNTKSTQIRKYSVTRAVTHSPGDYTFYLGRPGNIWSSSETFGEHGFKLSLGEGRSTLSQLLSLPAVESVRVRAMELHVQIGSAYDYDEAHDDIIAVIKEYLFEGAEVEVEFEANTLQSDTEKEILALDLEVREFVLCRGNSDARKNFDYAKTEFQYAKDNWLSGNYGPARRHAEKARFLLQLARQATI